MTSWRACIGSAWPFLGILLQLSIWQFTLAGNVTKQSNDICAEKNSPGFTLNLTSAMIFPGYLLIIDGKYLVYEVPRESLDSYGSMTFNIPGVPIEKKWPAFKNDTSWLSIKTEYKDIYHIFDKLNNSWIYMDIMNGAGIRYNLGKHKIESGFYYNSNYKEQLITNDNATRIYSIQVKNDTNFLPNMFVWKFFFEGYNVHGTPTPTGGFQMYYLVNKGNTSQKNLTVFSGGGAFTPEKNPLVGLVGYENYRLENISDWHFEKGHIPVGFIYKGFFHLYDLDKIMIFADAMPSYETVQQMDFQAGALLMNVKVTFISVKAYFQCGSDPSESGKRLASYPPDPVHFLLATKGTPLLFYISIGVGVLAILVILALLVYCCTAGGSLKSKKSKSKHHKKGDRNRKKKKGEEGGSVHTGMGGSLEKKQSRGTVHSRATGQSRPSAKLSLPK